VRWGIYLTGAGHSKVPKNTKYPLIDEPTHHYFQWSKGRRLSKYQLLYITKGSGVFESENSPSKKVHTGDIFILFPGIWHRFKCDYATGWNEYWVEFNGDLIDHFKTNKYLNPKNPVLKIGVQESIIENYINIIHLIRDEKPGYQYLASGHLMQILGQIFASVKYQPFEGKVIENQIKQAKLLIFQNMHTTISQEDLAYEVGLGYSLYRKKFKEYTGVSPAQYQIQLRIHKAKTYLINSDQSLKEIALNLGFESPNYFYRLFKQKTGITPSDYRDEKKR
jgi:AraC-like DNA-binding protein